MLSLAPRPSPAFHYLPDKDSFLAQLLKSHYHLPKALCLAISISKNFSSKTSLLILPEFALYILAMYFSYFCLDWPALPTLLCPSHPIILKDLAQILPF